MEEKVVYMHALRMAEKILTAVHQLDGKLSDASVLGLILCGEISYMVKEKTKDHVIYIHLERHIESATREHPVTQKERFDLIETVAAAAIEFRDIIKPP